MTDPYENPLQNPLRAVFGPIAWPRSYWNIFYLMLGFPLGLAYFVLYVTGISLGVGLLILLVGAAILLSMVVLTWPLTLLERELANRMLDAKVPAPGSPEERIDEDPAGWLRAILGNRVTWTGMVFLLLKFPLGLASWVLVVVLGAVSLGLTISPAVVALGGEVNLGFWHPVTVGEAFWLVPVGMAVTIVSFHLVNGLAWLWGRFAAVMLGRRPSPEPPVAEAPAGKLAPAGA